MAHNQTLPSEPSGQPWQLPAVVPSDVSEFDRDAAELPFSAGSGSSERDRFDADCGFAIAVFWLVGSAAFVTWLVR